MDIQGIRWLILCDRNGRKTEPILQIWDNDNGRWLDIDTVEIKEWTYDPRERFN
jgi:hypothetical protein